MRWLGFDETAWLCGQRLVNRASAALAVLLLAAGCGGKAATYEYFSNHVGGAAGAQGSLPQAGVSSTANGASGGSQAGEGGGPRGGSPNIGGANVGGGASDGGGGQATSTGGSAGALSFAGAGGVGGGSGGSEAAGSSGAAGTNDVAPHGCASVTECPRPANMCLTTRCVAGACITENAPAGSLYVLDAPADCHATTACDGLGHPTLVVDQDNAPTPAPYNSCLVGTCNDAGGVGTESLPRGATCALGLLGNGKCDGKSSCVACLVTADCPLGQTCTARHACIGTPCSDQNCGGACPACRGEACALDSDCASDDCDRVTHLCAPNSQCTDARQDGNETDTDCGGGTCPGCGVGRACTLDSDCATLGCDALTLTCAVNACADHHVDSDETDVDCGGTNPSCVRCGVGQRCASNYDCIPGHFCGSIGCQ